MLTFPCMGLIVTFVGDIGNSKCEFWSHADVDLHSDPASFINYVTKAKFLDLSESQLKLETAIKVEVTVSVARLPSISR